MSTVYSRNGSNIVAVQGDIISDIEDEIEVCIETGEYLFE